MIHSIFSYIHPLNHITFIIKNNKFQFWNKKLVLTKIKSNHFIKNINNDKKQICDTFFPFMGYTEFTQSNQIKLNKITNYNSDKSRKKNQFQYK